MSDWTEKYTEEDIIKYVNEMISRGSRPTDAMFYATAAFGVHITEVRGILTKKKSMIVGLVDSGTSGVTKAVAEVLAKKGDNASLQHHVIIEDDPWPLPFENRKIIPGYYSELDGPPITNRNRKLYAQTGNAKKPLKRRNKVKRKH